MQSVSVLIDITKVTDFQLKSAQIKKLVTRVVLYVFWIFFR